MKIRHLTDLHLEFEPFYYTPLDEDVVVLTGDIATPDTTDRFERFIESIPDDKKIIMIAGNHEYYHGVFEDANKYLLGLMDKYPNYTYLQNDATKIDDVHFFGGTMFTDFCLDGVHEQWFAMERAKRMIADFDKIRRVDEKNRLRKWCTDDHLKQHEEFRREFKGWLKFTEGQKRVVLTHFMCHPNGINPQYAKNAMNPYFCTNAEDLMGWEGLWFHGHTHTTVDIMVGETRVICNPKGYRIENAKEFKPNLIVEI